MLLCNDNGKQFVLLIHRKNEPFQHQWALPGGFVESTELVKEACARELLEETGLKLEAATFHFVNYYDSIQRDPRGRTLSLAFTSIITKRVQTEANDDAADAGWFALENLPTLAFDHYTIIQDAIKLNKKINNL
ncbi:NUDIX domain-containing protein [Psychroflexus tropicus]|uniref:NUDIX domain-containing protein n=1 Tax=Psychroflexus tropicus TaxID=197345 RepID=UPI001FE0B336|nr:NUDIX hydrolase [Psychroflexus tropicus]